jgi:hypothetical protein
MDAAKDVSMTIDQWDPTIAGQWNLYGAMIGTAKIGSAMRRRRVRELLMTMDATKDVSMTIDQWDPTIAGQWNL